MQIETGKAEKTLYLEGLRGLAAMMVFLGHLMMALLPGVVTFLPQEMHTSYDIGLGLSPLRAFFSVNLGICIFFVLSGFVLSNFCVYTKLSYSAQLVRRYLRLALPILITSMFAWLLFRLHLYKNFDVAVQLTKSNWLSMWYQFDPNFWLMVREALVNTFIDGSAKYNSNLWTIEIEMIGSAYIFLLHVLFKHSSLRLVVMALYIFLTPWSYYDGFFVGAALYDLRPRINAPDTGLWLDRGLREMMAAIGFAVGLWAGSFAEMQTGMTSPWHSWLTCNSNSVAWHMSAAVILLVSLLHSVLIQRIFQCRIAVFLGKISFVLYLIHLPIICSMTAWMAYTIQGLYYPAIVVVCGTITLGTTIAISAMAYKCTDLYATSFSRKAGKKFDQWFRIETVGN